MYRLEITPDLLDRANAMADKIPKTISKSILGGGGRLSGSLGELGMIHYLEKNKISIVNSNENSISYTDDIKAIVEDRLFRFEVKSTQRTVFVSQQDRKNIPFYAHLASTQLKNQEASDVIVFASIKYGSKRRNDDGPGYSYMDPEWVEIIGMYPSAKIRTDWMFRQKGEKGNDYKPATWPEFYLEYSKLIKIGQIGIPLY